MTLVARHFALPLHAELAGVENTLDHRVFRITYRRANRDSRTITADAELADLLAGLLLEIASLRLQQRAAFARIHALEAKTA